VATRISVFKYKWEITIGLAALWIQVFHSVTLVPASWEVGSRENPKLPYEF
jgi:hypothetical protein